MAPTPTKPMPSRRSEEGSGTLVVVRVASNVAVFPDTEFKTKSPPLVAKARPGLKRAFPVIGPIAVVNSYDPN